MASDGKKLTKEVELIKKCVRTILSSVIDFDFNRNKYSVKKD
jgi:hypothetical protein